MDEQSPETPGERNDDEERPTGGPEPASPSPEPEPAAAAAAATPPPAAPEPFRPEPPTAAEPPTAPAEAKPRSRRSIAALVAFTGVLAALRTLLKRRRRR
jgi:hypothetical protein